MSLLVPFNVDLGLRKATDWLGVGHSRSLEVGEVVTRLPLLLEISFSSFSSSAAVHGHN